MSKNVLELKAEIDDLRSMLGAMSTEQVDAALAVLRSRLSAHKCEEHCIDEHVDDGHCCEDNCDLEHVDDENHICEDFCERDHVDDFGNPEDVIGIAALAASKWMRKHGELPVDGEDVWIRDMREVMIALSRAAEDPTGSARDLDHALRYGSLAVR